MVELDSVKSAFSQLLLCNVRSGLSAVANRLRLSVLLNFISTGPLVVSFSSVTPSVVELVICVDKYEAFESDFAVAVTVVAECITSSLPDVKTPSVEYRVVPSVA